MAKFIFFLWMLSGKVKPQLDDFGYRNFDNGRPMYRVGERENLYKGEVLYYIKNKKYIIDRNLSDKNGKFSEPKVAVDTVGYRYREMSVSMPVFQEGKRRYVIDGFTKKKIYLR